MKTTKHAQGGGALIIFGVRKMPSREKLCSTFTTVSMPQVTNEKRLAHFSRVQCPLASSQCIFHALCSNTSNQKCFRTNFPATTTITTTKRCRSTKNAVTKRSSFPFCRLTSRKLFLETFFAGRIKAGVKRRREFITILRLMRFPRRESPDTIKNVFATKPI